MKLISKMVLFSVALLFAAMPAFACGTDDVQPDRGPAAISLYNDPELGETDSITLFALNAFESNAPYDLEFSQAGSDEWHSFNPLFGPFFGEAMSMSAYTFDQSGAQSDIINLDLQLSNSSGVVISDTAELTFQSAQTQMDGFDWFNWVELNWLDDEGESLDVTTVLSAWLPWDSHDMIGAAVPIPGTGLLLSLGLLCLIGRRSRRR